MCIGNYAGYSPEVTAKCCHTDAYMLVLSALKLDTVLVVRHSLYYICQGHDRMPSRRRKQDPKVAALRERGTLNPKPERVLDERFQGSEFFDAHDLLQVKYEMIRRVEIEGAPVAQAAQRFGFSRPSFYAAQTAFNEGGLFALLPKKRGPRGAHKLRPEVMRFIEEVRAADSELTLAGLLERIKERFEVNVHPRSLERALARLEKKRP